MVSENLTKLRSEIRLIICLGRKGVSEQSLAIAERLIAAGIDWDYLLAAVVFHGVFPTFFKHLKMHFAAPVPSKCFRMMTGHNDKIRFLNLALVGTYLQYHSALQKSGIESVIFKGPALALSLYDDLLMREFSDIDVLVSRSNAKAAQALLLEIGYQPSPERDPPLSREFLQSDVFFQLDCEHTFTRQTPTGVIDLHWEMQPHHILPLDFDVVLKNVEPIMIERRSMQTISANLSFIVLAAHASKHVWKRLLWIFDIAEMLEQQTKLNLDWAIVEKLAHDASVTPMVVLACDLAHQVFGCQIPDFAKTGMTPMLQEMAQEVLDKIAVLSETDAGTRLMGWKFCLQMRSSLSSKVRYLATEIFHPNVADYVRLPLPLSAHGAYYLLHPAWLVKDAIVRRLGGKSSESAN